MLNIFWLYPDKMSEAICGRTPTHSTLVIKKELHILLNR